MSIGGKWIMTEHKVMTVGEKHGTAMGGLPTVIGVMKAFHPGDEAPAGHEGRPYTRFEADTDETPATAAPRIDMGGDSQDRMDRGAGAVKRGPKKPRKE